MTRDLSETQAVKVMHGYGWVQAGFLGYWYHKRHDSRLISWLNAGDNYRARVAYMARELDKMDAEKAVQS